MSFQGALTTHLRELSPLLAPANLIATGCVLPGNELTCSLLLGSWITLLSDSPLTATTGHKPLRVYRRFVNSILQDGLLNVVVSYSKIADALTRSAFITDQGTTKVFVDAMKDTPIFPEYLEWFRRGDPVLFKYIMTFLVFAKKLSYKDESLYSTAFHKWEGVESRLATLELPSYVDHLRIILRHILAEFDDSVVVPRHGPGHVSNLKTRGRISKHVQMDMPKRLLWLFRPTAFGYTDGWRNGDAALHNPRLEDNRAKRAMEHTAKLIFVDKDVRSARSIAAEPAEYQYCQQAVRFVLENSIQASLIKRWFTLDDQTNNQRGALLGSVYNDRDTLDLKDSSDSVSLDLVRRIFPRRVLYYLLGTRSKDVLLPNKERRIVHKFAPMGSAVCFPTQSVIFSAIIILAAARRFAMMENLDLHSVLSYLPRYFRKMFGDENVGSMVLHPNVFGDDLVVSNLLTDDVIRILTDLGFQVNTEKSFIGVASYRESCGKHYLEGHDVTPMYFRVKNFDTRLGAAGLSSYLGAINFARENRYWHLRNFLIHTLKSLRVKIPSRRGGFNTSLIGSLSIMYSDDPMAYGITVSRARLDLHRHRREPNVAGRPWCDNDQVRVVGLTPEWDGEQFSKLKISTSLAESAVYHLWQSKPLWVRPARTTQVESLNLVAVTPQLRVDVRGATLRYSWKLWRSA